MQVLSLELLSEVSGGKEVPGYGKPGGIGGGSVPSGGARGGGNLVGFVVGLAVNAAWDAIKGAWDTRTTGNPPPEPIKSPEENNTPDATSLGVSGNLDDYEYDGAGNWVRKQYDLIRT
jgi:hypothetical protein